MLLLARLNKFEGNLQVDPDEVHATCWAYIKDIQRDADEHPETYTQWLLDEMHQMKWLQCGLDCQSSSTSLLAHDCSGQGIPKDTHYAF